MRSAIHEAPVVDSHASSCVFLTVEEVAERYRTSVKSIHDRTRTNRIPYLKRDGFRRLLFPLNDLQRWDEGAVLELVELPDGRAVRAQHAPDEAEAA
jgi:Helix-turn-helix domain